MQKSKTSLYIPPNLPNSYKIIDKNMQNNRNNYKFLPLMNKSNTFHLDRSKKNQIGIGINSSGKGEKHYSWVPMENLVSWNDDKVDTSAFYGSSADGSFSMGHPSTASAMRAVPPIAQTSDNALIDAIRP